MADLNKLTVPEYAGEQPYHWEYDNLPLKTLARRDEVINDQLIINTNDLREAHGSLSSVAARLDVSLKADGTLSSSAIDEAMHGIAMHEDDDTYVRFLKSERDKLDLIASEATNISFEVETPSNVILFDNGSLKLLGSETVTWQIENSNELKANLAFSSDAAHRHYKSIEPTTDDYIEFLVGPYQFIENSLEVYINGVRIFQETAIYVPSSDPSDAWKLMSFTEDHENKSFSLSTAASIDDVIRVDYEISLS